MNIVSVKKLLDIYSPSITGVLTSVFVFIYRFCNGLKEYEYIIPLVCGGVCTIAAIVIVEIIKRKKIKLKDEAVTSLLNDVKDKHTFYSAQLKEHSTGSELYEIYKSKIIELIEIEAKQIKVKTTRVSELEEEIKKADSFVSDGMDKLGEISNKKS
nr:MAG TPA: hypothetical protein [Caudoviricetes sp.]